MGILLPKVEFTLVGQLFRNGTFVIIGSGDYKITVLISPVSTRVRPRTDVIERWLKRGINSAISGFTCDNVEL